MNRHFKRYIKPDYAKSKSPIVPVYIRYDYDRTRRTLINTGQRINVDLHWNFKNNTIKRSCPEFEDVLKNIEEIENKMSNILQYARNNQIDPTPEYLVDSLQSFKELLVDNNKQTDFFGSLENFIVDRETNANVSSHAVRDYKSLKKHLLAFQAYLKRPITFSSLDKTFYDKFVYFLIYVAIKPDETIGLKLNTIGKQIKNLKVFYNDRKKTDKLPVVDFSDFKGKSEIVDHIYLTEREILQTWNFDLTENPELVQARDLLVFGCYTGLRYSDMHSLKPYHFKKLDSGKESRMVVQKTQNKTHSKVEIALIYLAKTVAEKYKYDLPKMHMNDFNEKVKLLGEKVGLNELVPLVHKYGKDTKEEVFKKYELLSSHVCRRSFATNMYLRGVDPEIIMTNTGHSNLKTLFGYIKITKREKALKLHDYFSAS